VEENAVLPLVLQESWAHSLAVFSSSFGHVKRGTLFSMYPDNTELGRSLAVSALDMLAGGGDTGMTPLREAQIAINLRTAKHLGVDADRIQGVDLTFPER
jgi:putative ABC transport system substrate-binding protein